MLFLTRPKWYMEKILYMLCDQCTHGFLLLDLIPLSKRMDLAGYSNQHLFSHAGVALIKRQIGRSLCKRICPKAWWRIWSSVDAHPIMCKKNHKNKKNWKTSLLIAFSKPTCLYQKNKKYFSFLLLKPRSSSRNRYAVGPTLYQWSLFSQCVFHFPVTPVVQNL